MCGATSFVPSLSLSAPLVRPRVRNSFDRHQAAPAPRRESNHLLQLSKLLRPLLGSRFVHRSMAAANVPATSGAICVGPKSSLPEPLQFCFFQMPKATVDRPARNAQSTYPARINRRWHPVTCALPPASLIPASRQLHFTRFIHPTAPKPHIPRAYSPVPSPIRRLAICLAISNAVSARTGHGTHPLIPQHHPPARSYAPLHKKQPSEKPALALALQSFSLGPPA